MVYAYIQDVPIGRELYRKVITQMGPEPIAGQLLHLCVRLPEGKLRYIDVWESEQACERAFEQRIHPASTLRSVAPGPTANPPCSASTCCTPRALLCPRAGHDPS